jgi:single-strand DNA-binding protein
MLRVELIGNTGAEAEQRYTPKGNAVASLRVAVNQRRQRPDGEAEETTTWFTVRAMGAVGERAADLSKGQRVLVIGRLDIRPYQRQDGTPGVAYDVWADDIVNLSPRAEPTDAGPAAGAATRSAAAGVTAGREAPASGEIEEPEEDLPFLWPRRVRGARVQRPVLARPGG